MPKSILQVAEVIFPEPLPSERFRVIETVFTIDGPRSRLTSIVGASIEEVRALMIKGSSDGNSQE